MFGAPPKVSIIVARHGSQGSWNRIVSVPVLVGAGLALVALVVLLLILLLQVADLSARAREVTRLREENADLAGRVAQVDELQAELARLQEFETRIRRWAGIDTGTVASSAAAAADARWIYEEAQLAEVPSLMPLQGWVSRGFEGGIEGHHGIDFVHEAGSTIRAAAMGVVRFADWDDTYGNLVILDHGNGFTTTYGHNESLLVQHGDLVPRGAPIARLGSTGRSSAPHLHFEIRLEDEPLDPAFLLSTGA
ncbi:M23 family metallopeptidase [bacterium]|nr:M23 family metallopeptidase [bacterium]